MSYSRLVLAAIAASLLGSTAMADSAPPAIPPSMGESHGMMHGMFTPEERMMIFADMSKATTGMSDEQKHAYRDQQRTRIMSMSDADRANFKADLDARWSSLPENQKAALTAKMEAFRASHHQNGAAQ